MIVTTPSSRAHDEAFRRIAEALDDYNWHNSWVAYHSTAFYLYGIWYERELEANNAAMQEKIRDKAENGDYD